MPVVKNIVKDASGAILDGTVTVDLIIFDGSYNPVSFQGFVDIPADTTSDYTINIPASTSITNGSWQMTLQGNPAIDDAYGASVFTYYRVQEVTNTVNRTYYINVPASGGPYWVGNIGATTPSIATSNFTLDSLVDVATLGATDGESLTFDSATQTWVPGPGGGGSGGTDGKTVRNGTGVPSNSLGVNGDFYINTTAWTIYGPKTLGTWGSPTALIGAAGAAGAAGVNGKTVLNGSGVPSVGTGTTGDFYIDTTNKNIYGPKTSVWGSATSLIGPTGAAGTPGATAVYRGTWSSAASYAKNDVVDYLGSSYYAVVASSNVAPSSDITKWTLAAAKGASGGEIASFSVEDYGAVGDGVTDDTVAIQSAIDASTVGSKIKFGNKTYIISATIKLKEKRSYSGAFYQGSTTIKQKNSTNMTTPMLASELWYTNAGASNGIMIENLAIDGNKANNASSTSDGIVIFGWQSVIRNVHVFDCKGSGIVFTDESRNGTSYSGTNVENRIENCRISTVDGRGIYVWEQTTGASVGGTGKLTDGFCINNIINGALLEGIYIQRGAGWLIDGNHTYTGAGLGQSGIWVKNCFSTRVTNNYIDDYGETATSGFYSGIRVEITTTRGSVVSGNTISCSEATSASTYRHLYVLASPSITSARAAVFGNVVNGNSQTNGTGIRIEAGSGTTLACHVFGNRVDGCNISFTGVATGTLTGRFDLYGSGTPESVITAPIGSTWTRSDGSNGTTMYIKESGTGNTGWSAVGSGGSIRINVVNYGAVGDGVTDDSAAIQAAIDAANWNATFTGRSGVVWFPLGKYYCATGLTATDNATHPGLTLQGEGVAGIDNNLGSAATEIIVGNGQWGLTLGSGTSSFRGYSVRDLGFSEKNAGLALGGLRIRGSSNGVYERCSFGRFTAGYGIYVDGIDAGTQAQYNTFYDCRVGRCLIGYHQNNANGTRWLGGYFDGNNNGGLSLLTNSIGIEVTSGDTFRSFGTVVQGFTTLASLAGRNPELHGMRAEIWSAQAVLVTSTCIGAYVQCHGDNSLIGSGGANGLGIVIQAGATDTKIEAQIDNIRGLPPITDAGTRTRVIGGSGQATQAAVVGTVTGNKAEYDQFGALMGYSPIYDAITGISLVRNLGGSNPGTTGLTTVTRTLQTAATVGDTLIILGGYGLNSTVTVSASDSKGNTYTVNAHADYTASSSTPHSFVISAPITTGLVAGDIITVTFSSAVNYPIIFCYEFAGLLTSTPDATANATGTGTSVNSGSLSASVSNALLISSVFSGNGSHTPGTGYVELDEAQNTTKDFSSQYKFGSAAGTYTSSATISGSTDWAVSLVAYKPVPSTSIDIDPYVFNVKQYGAVGDGSTDDTTAIQSAYTAAAVSGGVVVFPSGTYKITSTLTRAKSVRLEGLQGSTSSAGFYPTLLWAGSAGGTMETITVTGAVAPSPRDTHMKWDGGGTTSVPLAAHAITSADRMDWDFGADHCAYVRFRDSAIVLSKGAVNASWDNCRWDIIANYGIEILDGDVSLDPAFNDNISITGGTWDGYGPTAGTKGFINYSPVKTASAIHLGISNFRMEINGALVVPASGRPKALVSLDLNVVTDPLNQATVVLSNVMVTPVATAYDITVVGQTGATDVRQWIVTGQGVTLSQHASANGVKLVDGAGVAGPPTNAGYPFFVYDPMHTQGAGSNSTEYDSKVWIGPGNIIVPGSLTTQTGTWTPIATGPATMPATWTGIWEQLTTDTYHIAIIGTVTGGWSGSGSLSVTLPSTWARHADKSMHVAGHLSFGSVFYNLVGIVDPISKSNTAPTIKFITPNVSTSSITYSAVSGVGSPITFTTGILIEVSGVIRVA